MQTFAHVLGKSNMKELKSMMLALSLLLWTALPSLAVNEGAAQTTDSTDEEEEVDFFDSQVTGNSKNTKKSQANALPVEATSEKKSDSKPSTVTASEPVTVSAGTAGKPGDVPDNALQGFVDILNQTEAPTLKALTPAMDDVNTRFNLKTDKSTLNASASVDRADERRRQVSEGVTRFGTASLLLYTDGSGYWTVTKPLRGGAADVAGIKPGDRIWSVDGRPVPASLDMNVAYQMITGTRGQTKYFVVQRLGRYLNIPVRLFNVYEIRNRESQHIEYTSYLLHYGHISVGQYQRMMDMLR